MTTEKQLVQKGYYETFLMNTSGKDAMEVLGDAYMEEQKKEISDLSAIRFAQGELYFHYKDYESAIFKWENIHNKFEPWAKKNMADAYFELGLLPTAENIYKSIATEDLTLRTEIYLQLFSIYMNQGKEDQASIIIKETVLINPDYQDVTRLAKAFFEKNEDWPNAIELAIGEAIRLDSVSWFDVLLTYVENGLTDTLEPSYFESALLKLESLDSNRFEIFASALWNRYKQRSDTHIAWLSAFDRVIEKLDDVKEGPWEKLAALYEESYLLLINGTHLIKEVSSLIPSLLTNWLNVCNSKQALKAAAVVVSWHELFPETLHPATVYKAENFLLELEQQSNDFTEGVKLADELINWSQNQDITVPNEPIWIMDSLRNIDTFHLMVVGTTESGKEKVINTLIGENVLPIDHSSLTIIQYADNLEILEITESSIQQVETIAEQSSYRLQSAFQVKVNSPFLQEEKITFITTPSLNENYEITSHLRIADGILFVLNGNTPFTEKEQVELNKIKESVPNTPIHFLMNNEDNILHDYNHVIEETKSRIKEMVSDANVFSFSLYPDSQKLHNDLGEFIFKYYDRKNLLIGRTSNLLFYIRVMIAFLLNKRIEKEDKLVDSIRWNEEVSAKLTGAIHQIGDLEAGKIRGMTKSYLEEKEKIVAELKEKVPNLLRDCTDYIKEDSDFGNLHLELNDEMNRRVGRYLQETILPQYYHVIMNWITNCANDFNEIQSSLDEMCESFHSLYNIENLQLTCDFKILDDWRRDADRMTSSLSWKNLNILLRFTPSQFLLKSASKLLAGMTQNKSILYNKYKQYVGTEDYFEVAESVVEQFLEQFELFEKSIERDISMFFREPLSILNKTVEDSRLTIIENKQQLTKLRQNPETYQDPLTFFELKLRQNEWLNQKSNPITVST